MDARRELAEVLRQARNLLGRPGNDFAWSSWEDGPAALAHLDRCIAAVEQGPLPPRSELTILFAPTGSIQEVSLSSGWAGEFLALASRFDASVERVWT